MELLIDTLEPVAKFIRSNLGDIAMIIVATLLTIYGSNINNFVRNAISSFHFVVRVAIFMALFAFGYGAITAYLVPHLAQLLATLPNVWLPLAMLGAFVLLGILVEKKRA